MPSSRCKSFRLFAVFSIGVPLYAFGRRKRHSASFLNSHADEMKLFVIDKNKTDEVKLLWVTKDL